MRPNRAAIGRNAAMPTDLSPAAASFWANIGQEDHLDNAAGLLLLERACRALMRRASSTGSWRRTAYWSPTARGVRARIRRVRSSSRPSGACAGHCASCIWTSNHSAMGLAARQASNTMPTRRRRVRERAEPLHPYLSLTSTTGY